MADNGNPFDRPLDSELQEHQQQQAATVQASSNGNPFDEPLLSEKAEAARQAPSGQGAAAISSPDTISTGPEGSNSDQQLMSEASQSSATTGGLIAGAALPLGLAGASLLPEAGPIVAKASEYLGHLSKIAKVARDLGFGAIGLGEAHKLYKEFAGDKK